MTVEHGVVKPVSGKASGAIESGAGKIEGAGKAVDRKAHSVGENLKESGKPASGKQSSKQ